MGLEVRNTSPLLWGLLAKQRHESLYSKWTISYHYEGLWFLTRIIRLPSQVGNIFLAAHVLHLFQLGLIILQLPLKRIEGNEQRSKHVHWFRAVGSYWKIYMSGGSPIFESGKIISSCSFLFHIISSFKFESWTQKFSFHETRLKHLIMKFEGKIELTQINCNMIWLDLNGMTGNNNPWESVTPKLKLLIQKFKFQNGYFLNFTNEPCLPFLVCPSFLQLLSHRWASYLPVHLCLQHFQQNWSGND